MLHYAVVFVVLALISALFAFGAIAGSAAGVAKLLFILFAVLAVASFIMGLISNGGPDNYLIGDLRESNDPPLELDVADKEAIAFINKHPIVSSLLYDINLLPEQLEVGSHHWGYMHAVVQHLRLLVNQVDERQAQIDRLMLEHCPDEMTPAQKERWAASQRVVDDVVAQKIDLAVKG